MDIRSFFSKGASKREPCVVSDTGKKKRRRLRKVGGDDSDSDADEDPTINTSMGDTATPPPPPAAASTLNRVTAVAPNEDDVSSVDEPATCPADPAVKMATDEVVDARGKVDAEVEGVGCKESAPSSCSMKPKAEETSSAKTSKFDPVKGATWKRGESVPYSALVKVFEAIEATTKRLVIQEHLRDFFRSVIALSPHDLLACVYLSCNKLAPAYHGIEIGIGDSILIKAASLSTGRTPKSVKEQYEKVGDLGTVAAQSRSSQKHIFGLKPKPLSVRGVHQNFLNIAKMSGSKSQERKASAIQKMLVAGDSAEVRFLMRGLQGKLRIGLAEQTVLVSLAHAVIFTPPAIPAAPVATSAAASASASSSASPVLDASKGVPADIFTERLEVGVVTLKQVYSELPSYDEVIPTLLRVGLAKLPAECHVRAGVPLKPMLAKPTKGVSEVLERFADSEFTCEFKYDGERAQIHCLEDGTMRIYSRNSEDNTGKYPDVIERIPGTMKEGVTSFILDSEVVAYDTETKKFRPFQVLSTRAKKNADASNVKVRVIVCAFDLLYLNGRSLLRESLRARRKALRESFVEAKMLDASDTEEIGTFLNEAVEGNCEGLMVKTLEKDATYQPAKRSLNWLKLKKDYMDGLADSLDLVPIGAYKGRGKRTGVYGAFLLAAYNDEDGVYESICKIGTGFSEEQLKAHAAFFEEHIAETKPRCYDSEMEPDVWFEPRQVWEVRAADLSISPVHRAAIGRVNSSRGIALRFPRFLRIRDDKDCESATNASQVADMYRQQPSVAGGGAGVEQDGDDYF